MQFSNSFLSKKLLYYSDECWMKISNKNKFKDRTSISLFKYRDELVTNVQMVNMLCAQCDFTLRPSQ